MNYQAELQHWVINTGALTAVLAFAAVGAGVSTYFGTKSMVPATGIEGTLTGGDAR